MNKVLKIWILRICLFLFIVLNGYYVSAQHNWTYNSSDYSYSGEIYATAFINSSDASNGSLGAFVGSENRGYSDTPLYSANADQYYFTFSVYSNTEGETISFSYFNGTNTYDITETISFTDEMVEGSENSPLSFTVNNSAPVVASAIEDQPLNEGFASTTIDLASVFSDADDDILIYTAVSSNEDVVTVSEALGILTITETGIGQATITVTASDGSLSVDDVFNVEVDAIPVITSCAEDKAQDADANCESTVPDLTTEVVATDDGTIESVTQSPVAGTVINVGVTSVTITVTDDAGNTATCSATVTVNDVTAPVPDVTTLPDLTGECSVTATPPTATDACVGAVTAYTTDPTLYNVQGSYTITWIYDDGNGNEVTQTQEVIIDDVTAPEPDLATLPDVTAECEVTALTEPTATDNCASAVTVTSDAELPITTQGTTVVTWTYDDGNDNTTTQTQNVVINDVTPPTITAPTAIIIDADLGTCEATGVSLGTPVTDDNCGVESVTNDAEEPYAPGVNTITWTVTDLAGNTTEAIQLVTVVDNQDPEIAACATNKSQAADENGESIVPDLTSEIVASDNCDADLTITQSPAAGETIGIGITTVTITVADDAGNTASCTANVSVTDETSPEITACASDRDQDADENCQSTVPDLTSEVEANDNGTIASITQTPEAGTLIPLGETIVIITVTDNEGNIATCTATITVNDVTLPVPDLATLPDITAECEVATLTAPTATDNCAGIVTATSDVTLPITTQGTTVVTWTYDDGNGNTVTQSQNIVIADITDPIITAPSDINVVTAAGLCYPEDLDLGQPVTSDNCGILSVTNDAEEPLSAGIHTITWTVTDNAGNTATSTQIVTVEDNEPPIILTCADNLDLIVDENSQATVPDLTLEVAALDNCDDALTITQQPVSGTVIDTGRTTVVILVTDDAGNADSCQVVLNAIHDLPAEWTFEPADYLYSGQVNAKVIIDGSEANSGMLGAFYGDECRGIVEVSYFEPADHYVFDLLVHSNSVRDEYLTFKYFNYYTAETYTLVDSIEFIPDMFRGTALVPYEMNYFNYSNNLFVPGWSWFSINVTPANNTLSSVMSGDFVEGDYIKSQTQSATYYDDSGWFGQLTTINPGVLYKASFSDSMMNTTGGYSIDLQNMPISLGSGWNWIGYLPTRSMSVEDAMSALTLTELDYIKSQFNSAVYYEGYGWFGGLTELRPGEGYMINLANPDQLLFPEISAKKSLTAEKPSDRNKYVDPAKFAFSGNITAKIITDNVVSGSAKDTLFAYVGDECRGLSPAMYFEPLNEFVFQMLIFSNIEDGERISFKYYDSKLDETYDLRESVKFTSDMFLADVYNSFEFDLNNVVGIRNMNNQPGDIILKLYPNPFKNILHFDLNVTETSDVRIEIFDIVGSHVEILDETYLEKGSHLLKWNASGLKSGTYIVRAVFNDRTIMRKVTMID